MTNKRLFKKVAVVTGASSGVGRAIALALANEGADLALLGRSMDLLQGLAHQCNERGAESVLCVGVDLLSEESTQQAKKKVEAVFDGADILVHSAGMIMQGHVATASLSDFNLQHRCNVMAPLLLTQLFLSSLIKAHGHIVFINSTAGLVSSAGLSQYSATKHALKALADSLREEVNPHGVRVLSVYLGRTATPMQASIHQTEGKSYRPEQLIQPDQVAAVVVAALTIGPEAEIMDVRIRPTLKPRP